MKMNKQGIVTVKTLIMLVSVLLIFSVLIADLTQDFYDNQEIRNVNSQMNSILSHYDTRLYVEYGLYSVKFEPERGYLYHDMYKPDTTAFQYEKPLSAVAVMTQAIKSYMLPRLPANYMSKWQERIKVVQQSSQTKSLLEKKEVLDVLLNDFGHELNQVMMFQLRANDLNSQEIEKLTRKYADYFVTYEVALEMNRGDVLLEIQRQIADMEATMASYLSINENLFDEMVTISKEIIDVARAIDTFKDEVQEDDDVIDAVKNVLLEEVILYREKLLSGDTGQVPDDFIQYMIELDREVPEVMYEPLYLVFNNIQVLKEVKDFCNWSSFVEGHRIDRLNEYQQHPLQSQLPDHQDNQGYVNEQKKLIETNFTVEVDGAVAQDLFYSSNEQPDFWAILDSCTNEVLDRVIVSEYVMTAFKSFVASDTNDYFSKNERKSYFNCGEVEYILIGNPSEVSNIIKTQGIVFGIRTIMNTLHVYTDKDKLLLSESIGLTVAGWSGFGAPLVTNIIRVGWATGESLIDMKALNLGEKVPFLKLSAEEWQLDIGLTAPKTNTSIKGLSFDYNDYLSLMLLTLNHDTLVKRIVNVIQLNMSMSEPFLISECYTEVHWEGLTRGYYVE